LALDQPPANSSSTKRKYKNGKAKRTDLSLDQKIAIIEAVESGQKQAHVAKEYGIAKQTVSNFIHCKKELREFYGYFGNEVLKSRKRIRFTTLIINEIEDRVSEWIASVLADKSAQDKPTTIAAHTAEDANPYPTNSCSSQPTTLNDPEAPEQVTRETIKIKAMAQARALACQLQAKGDAITEQEQEHLAEIEAFSAGNAWLNNFIKRNKYSNI
jgi:hypothetical protein